MLIREILRVALGALRANKLRSFLTLLGIMIGVAAVIAMDALGRGAQRSVNERIAALGTTLLTVMPGQAVGMGGVRMTDQQKMTADVVKTSQAATNNPAHVHCGPGRARVRLRRRHRHRHSDASARVSARQGLRHSAASHPSMT